MARGLEIGYTAVVAVRTVNRRAGVLAAILGIVATAGCDDEPRSTPAIERGGEPRPKPPLLALSIGAVKRATVAAVHLQRTPNDRARYLDLRRELARAEPFVRARGPQGSEALFGVPPSEGALRRLDRAIEDGDAAARRAQLAEVVRALRLLDHELTLGGVPPEEALEAIHHAALDLGERLAEANPGAPRRPDAVLADLRGLVLSIHEGLETAERAYGRRPPLAEPRAAALGILAPLEEALAEASDAYALTRRATLIRATGPLGVALRRFAAAAGVELDLPFRARQPVADNGIDEPITILTLPAPPRAPPPKVVALGRRLFLEPALSPGGRRACVTCHDPAHAYGGATAHDPTMLRHTPGLLYAPLHAVWGWDGRFPRATRPPLDALHGLGGKARPKGSLAKALTQKKDAGYAQDFTDAFPDGLTEANVSRALEAFLDDTFVPGASRLDRFARGEAELAATDHAGFDLFVGKARCSRCHLPPTFGGTRAPAFTLAIYANLGIPKSPSEETLDEDAGRYGVTGDPADRHAFRVPTVRNAARTAPYFHHGVYPDLEAAIDLHTRGGGRGLGLDVPAQSPRLHPVKLSTAERAQLGAFVRETLRDERWYRPPD